MTPRYAIFVTLKLKPGMGEDFRPLILTNAAATRREEPDNHEFQVSVSADDPDRYHFYEVYTDEQALETHRQTEHFKTYFAATKDMIAERTVAPLHVIDY